MSELRRLRALVHLSCGVLCDAVETRRQRDFVYEYANWVAQDVQWEFHNKCTICNLAAPCYDKWLMNCVGCEKAYCKIHLPKSAVSANFWMFSDGTVQKQSENSDLSFIVCESCQKNPQIQKYMREYS